MSIKKIISITVQTNAPITLPTVCTVIFFDSYDYLIGKATVIMSIKKIISITAQTNAPIILSIVRAVIFLILMIM
jgi:hypothetical protein